MSGSKLAETLLPDGHYDDVVIRDVGVRMSPTRSFAVVVSFTIGRDPQWWFWVYCVAPDSEDKIILEDGTEIPANHVTQEYQLGRLRDFLEKADAYPAKDLDEAMRRAVNVRMILDVQRHQTRGRNPRTVATAKWSRS